MLTCQLGDEGVLAIANARELRGLRKLDLSHAVASADTWRAFVRSPVASRLTALALDAIDLPLDAIEALVANAVALEELAVTVKADMSTAALRAIAASPIAARLERLAIAWLGNDSLAVALDGPWPSLRELGLSAALDERTIELIANRRGVPRLQKLFLPHRSQIPTGRDEIWNDQGIETTGGPEYVTLRDLRSKHFANDALVLEGSDSLPRWF